MAKKSFLICTERLTHWQPLIIPSTNHVTGRISDQETCKSKGELSANCAKVMKLFPDI